MPASLGITQSIILKMATNRPMWSHWGDVNPFLSSFEWLSNAVHLTLFQLDWRRTTWQHCHNVSKVKLERRLFYRWCQQWQNNLSYYAPFDPLNFLKDKPTLMLGIEPWVDPMVSSVSSGIEPHLVLWEETHLREVMSYNPVTGH